MPCFEFEGTHEVSNQGRVRSTTYVKYHAPPPRYLTPHPDKDGYYRVLMWPPGSTNGKNRIVSRLVASTFIRPPIGGEQVNHIDGIKAHNWVDNLEWGTGQYNIEHARVTGLKAAGEQIGRARLTEEQVLEIRSLRGQLSYGALAVRFHVTKSAINHIMAGRSWSALWSFRRLHPPSP